MKEKTTLNDDSYLSLWNMSNNSWEDLGNFAKIYPKEKRESGGDVLYCVMWVPRFDMQRQLRAQSVKDDFTTAGPDDCKSCAYRENESTIIFKLKFFSAFGRKAEHVPAIPEELLAEACRDIFWGIV